LGISGNFHSGGTYAWPLPARRARSVEASQPRTFIKANKQVFSTFNVTLVLAVITGLASTEIKSRSNRLFC